MKGGFQSVGNMKRTRREERDACALKKTFKENIHGTGVRKTILKSNLYHRKMDTGHRLHK